jgi:hypothetical protein
MEKNSVLLSKQPNGFDVCGHNSNDYEDYYILEYAAMYLYTFNMEARGFFRIQEPTDHTHMAFIPYDNNLQPK